MVTGSSPRGRIAYASRMPDWAPPLIAAGSAIVALNAAYAVMRFRQRYGLWAVRTFLELRRWDGRL